MLVAFTHRTMPFSLQVWTQFLQDRDYALLLPDIYTVTVQVASNLIQDLSASRCSIYFDAH
ncbi:hypothetical protein C8J57DRAFT_1501927 [Mycena rebaudengoi]|nr:hypothetical protein C8J57DRAFT_1501927 [Mycena rebaudengoi]